MRTTAKSAVTALVVAIVLASALATASARSLSVSEQSIRVSWASIEFPLFGTSVRCRLTLEGSFHGRSIAKSARSLIGSITQAIFGHPCTNGEFWADNGTEAEPLGTAPNRLPWHLTYESFTGTLPNISAVGLLLNRISVVFQGTLLGITARCRYGRTEDNISLAASREAGGGITGLAPVSGRERISLLEGLRNGGACVRESGFTGRTGPMTGLSNSNTITISLI